MRERARLTTVEIQQAIRVNLFHILQASARAESTGVPAKGLTGQAYEGQYFWDTEIYLFPFLNLHITPYSQELLRFRYGCWTTREPVPRIGPPRRLVSLAYDQW